jgi:glycosyltransferase involved in cell wall biosynthesis
VLNLTDNKKINILQVDDNDIIGSAFNGHNLQISLNELGFNVCQVVKNKISNDKNTYKLGLESNTNCDRYLSNLERELSMNNILGIWDRYLENSEQYQNADIVHYHKVHTGIISQLRYEQLYNSKPSVWTIHDPWIFTGHCIHPLECEKWKISCDKCPRLHDHFPLKQDKTSQLWEIKKKVIKNIDIDIIVSTDFMLDFIRNSPITCHLKKIHKISFGVKLNLYNKYNKLQLRNRMKIQDADIVIGFRVEDYFIKGCNFIYEALDNLSNNNLILLTVGYGKIPEEIKKKFRTIELGWQNDERIISEFFTVCDIFLMPSLAESFGMMAIEAMASECTVIVFKSTVLENLVFSPNCGIAVEYKSSIAIRNEIVRLLENPLELKIRGEKARKLAEQHYDYNNYVIKHIELYNEIYSKQVYLKKLQ